MDLSNRVKESAYRIGLGSSEEWRRRIWMFGALAVIGDGMNDVFDEAGRAYGALRKTSYGRDRGASKV